MAARKKLPGVPRPPAAPGPKRRERYVLKLYVAGMNSRSSDAIRTTTTFCDERLRGGYRLEIIDIYQQPELTQAARIKVVPTLVREHPVPLKRLVGTLAGLDAMLAGRDREGPHRQGPQRQGPHGEGRT